jgi:hypothetical protein
MPATANATLYRLREPAPGALDLMGSAEFARALFVTEPCGGRPENPFCPQGR